MVLSPFGAERGEEHRHAGADVGRLHAAAVQLRRPDDDGAVRVAQHDARAHADQLVHEEQPRLEHLLVDDDHALALRRRDERDGHRIRRERGPRLILELRHRAAEVAADLHLLVRRDDEVLALDATDDAEALEAHERGAQVLDAGALDA